MSKAERDWLRGFAAALAAFSTKLDRPDILKLVMEVKGVSVDDFREASIEPTELYFIETAVEEAERRETATAVKRAICGPNFFR